MKKRRNYFHRKSKCCKAEIEYGGGGYDGEDIVPVTSYCKKCGENNPKIIQRVGRPKKIPF